MAHQMPLESVIEGNHATLGASGRETVRLWGPPLIAAILYPTMVALFGDAIGLYHRSGDELAAIAAAAIMACAYATPSWRS